VNGIPGQEEGEDGLVEVTKTGTGFMLIRREVFEKMNAHPAVRPFNNDIGLPAELDPHMKTYFDTAVRENRYYSEDWTFCENWRDLGGKVYIDKRVLLKHVGTYVFDGATQDKLYQDLHAMAAPRIADAHAAAAAAPPVDAEPEVFATSEPVPEETKKVEPDLAP
jgi:hypothetical protein